MIETTRDKLYEEVWAAPMTKVAGRYGISDVGLKKICVKHRIPTPPRGYWARLYAGKKDKKTIYREVSDPALNRISIYGQDSGLDPEVRTERKIRTKETKRKIEQVLSADTPRTSADRHPIAVRFHDRLAKKRPDQRGFITNHIKSCFRADISPVSVERAANFFSAFFRATEAAGYALEKSDNGLTLKCDDEDLGFELSEKTDRTPHVLKPKEEARQKKYVEYRQRQARNIVYDRWGWREYVSKPEFPEFDYFPNGQLAFRFTSGCYGVRATFADGKTQTIEKLLPAIIAGARNIADQRKKEREESRIRELKWEEQRKIARERRQLANLERLRVESMEGLLGEWQKAAEVRAFVDAARTRAQNPDVSDTTDEWIEWASSYADRLDPLTAGAPKLAKMEDFSSWELDRYR